MKRVWQWVEVGFALVALAIVVAFLVYAFKLHGDAAAAWVQAVGSIAAIVGAFQVGKFQADAARKQAIEMDETKQRQRYEAIGAIVQGAWDQLDVVAEMVNKMPREIFIHSLDMVQSIPESLSALTAIPLHELGSYGAVISINSLISSVKQAEHSLQKVFAEGIGISDAEFERCKGELLSAGALGGFHAEQALRSLGVHSQGPFKVGIQNH